jgi:hypothetical protein
MMGLLESRTVTEADVVAAAAPVTRTSCVYFLMRGGKVVYIGKTDCPQVRIAQHLQDKEFDSAAVYEVEKRYQSEIETMLIARFRPGYNHSNGKLINGFSGSSKSSYGKSAYKAAMMHVTVTCPYTKQDVKLRALVSAPRVDLLPV